jgi:hypothetical protein
MGNNYFQPRTYTMPTAPKMPAVTVPTVNEFTDQATLGSGFAGQSNSGTRQMLAGLIWGNTDAAGVRTPGVFDNMRTQMGTTRDSTKAATAGFGGIRWVPDDTSTPNVDESLTPQYDPNGIGKNERGAVQGGQQQANARGMMYSSFGDQMVGAALQRVGEQARGVINQYAGQLNTIANQAQATAGSYLGSLGSLYGSDAQEYATGVYNQKMLDIATAASNAPAPAPGPAATTRADIQTNQESEYPITNDSWAWKTHPNSAALDKQFGYGNYLIVKKPGGGWTVRVKG